MAPLRDYLCSYCGHEFTELVYGSDPDDYTLHECRCGSKAKVLPSVIGGYNGVSLSGARKKNSSAQKSAKPFTGHPGTQGEPENKQLELEFTQNGIDGKDVD